MIKEKEPDGVKFWPTYRALTMGFLTSLFEKELYKECGEHLLAALQGFGIVFVRLAVTFTFPLAALIFTPLIIRDNKRTLERQRKMARPIQR